MPAEQREMMESMLGDMTYDIAIYKDAVIYTMGNDKIEDLIDRLKDSSISPVPLVARGTFPDGAFYYGDFDVGKYFSFINAMVSEIPDSPDSLQKIAETLAGSEPVTMSGFCNNGRLEARSEIPGGLLIRAAQAGQMIAMEAMQKKAARQAEKKKEQLESPAPDTTLNVLDGATVKLSDHIGKQVVVLDFWASWCGPCRRGLPIIQKAADQFADADVVFYAINLREDEDTIKKFFGEAGLTLPVVMDDGTLGDAFGVSGIPHTVIIGKDGTIQTVHTGFSLELETQLPEEISAALAD